MARTLEELIETNDPAWPVLQEWIATAEVPVEVLPPDLGARETCLLEIQVTTRSPMGAVVYETGGLLIDHGWLRVLGSGHPRFPRTLPGWNAFARKELEADDPGFLFIADDVLGGFFALDCGGLGDAKGEVFYFGPDTLRWENLEVKYSAFLQQMMSASLQKFYSNVRWDGWETEVSSVQGARSIMMYPFLWTTEGKDPSKNKRSTVPITETFGLHLIEFPKQLGS